MADKATRVPARPGRGTSGTREAPQGRSAAATSEKPGQGDAYGGNPPDLGEDQNVREAGMYDIADAAQNQMPGRPQNVTIGRGRAPQAASDDAPSEERVDKRPKR